MIKIWTKWRISVAVERGKPLSPALARCVERDPECRRFHEASLAMTERLRRDASRMVREETQSRQGIRHEPFTLAPARRTQQPRRAPAFVAASAAVGLVVGAAFWWLAGGQSADSPVAMKESDMIELVQLVRQIKHNVNRAAEEQKPRLRQILDRSENALREPLTREAENMANDTRNLLQAFSLFADAGDTTEPRDSGELK
ncbi:MAG: hypothetical protein JW888_08265 [Pirellulales bacterium]|nr:hypothetical protein [Pirellulales bacterium]